MIELKYKNKIDKETILNKNPLSFFEPNTKLDNNLLIFGDNFDGLKNLLLNGFVGKIDLIYIDPPFGTNIDFTITSEKANSISRVSEAQIAYSDKIIGYEYLEFLRQRLILLRELLTETGSIYLHIDYKIGHYVKIIMDEIFGQDHFINDLTRIKCNPKNFQRKAFGNIKDLILFYSKSNSYTWNDPRDVYSYDEVISRFSKTTFEGRRYTTVPIHAPGETLNGDTGTSWRGLKPPKGRHWRCSPEELDNLDNQGLIEWSANGNPRKIIYADETIDKGKKIQDIVMFKDKPNVIYPTEKNIDLLKLLIKASSNEGDVVLDCFCGSGTTLVAAELLNRRWIGIDQSASAIEVTSARLDSACYRDVFGPQYELIKLKKDISVCEKIS